MIVRPQRSLAHWLRKKKVYIHEKKIQSAFEHKATNVMTMVILVLYSVLRSVHIQYERLLHRPTRNTL